MILRRDFRKIEASEDIPEHYTYEEGQMTADPSDVYPNIEQIIGEQSDALVELAGMLSEVI